MMMMMFSLNSPAYPVGVRYAIAVDMLSALRISVYRTEYGYGVIIGKSVTYPYYITAK